MEGLFPGRWDALRPVKPKELKATRLLRVRIDEADFTWPAWGGIIPIKVKVGVPQPDEHVKDARLRADPRQVRVQPKLHGET
jgi:hypothetical protein